MDQRKDWHLTELLNNPQGRGDPFAAAVRATRMPMIITDPRQADNPIVFVNEAFQTLSGYGREEIIGRNCRFMQGPDTDQETVAAIRRAIAAGEDIEADILNYRKDGSTFWNALYLSPVRGDEGDIRFFFASQLDVTERVETRQRLSTRQSEIEREVTLRTRDLEAALEEKTLLLHEVDHRVKNNLNMIGSLLRLQARSIKDPKVSRKLNEMLERVDALAAVHRRLYQSDDVRRFDIGGFVATLVRNLLAAAGRRNIELRESVVPLIVPSARAAPIGLVVNEVLTNCLKHGFGENRSGVLTVLTERDRDVGIIRVEDDGPGMDLENRPSHGLGHTLITRLGHQAGVEVEYRALSPGLSVSLRFPVEG